MTVFWSVGVKLATMAVALGCGVMTTRLVLGEAGAQYYALYSLLITLPTLISFTDLGSGAAVVNAMATSDDPARDPHLLATVTTVYRIILGFAVGVLILNGALLVTGSWGRVLGATGTLPGAELTASICLLTFSVTISFAIWQRLLLGLHKNHLLIALQGLQSPLNLLIVWLLLTVGKEHLHTYLALGSFLSALAVAAFGYATAKRLTRPLLARARSRLLRFRQFKNAKVMDVGWPMMAQVLSAPLSMGLQRYVLAQSASTLEVAEYGVLGQVFFSLQGLVGAAGLALWPAFARARQAGTLRRGPYLISMAFAGGVVVATIAVWLLRGPLFTFISHGELSVSSSGVLLFGGMIAVQAALYPLGMFIMDIPGLRFQVIPVVLMTVSTVILSVAVTPALGLVGPLLANTVSVAIFQVIPFSFYIHRHRGRLWSSGGTVGGDGVGTVSEVVDPVR